MVLARGPDRARLTDPEQEDVPAPQRLSSDRAVVLSLVGIAVFSILIRALLGSGVVAAPTVFNDELGYSKLAQGIGLHGRLTLFDQEGFSYSPLYPALLSPIYALGASAPTAYALIKTLNAVLISLSVFPLYKIARFALPRSYSLLAAALSVFAPLMSYSSFAMSENLAYPLCLTAIWAILAAVRQPGPRADTLLLAAILLATMARIQLIVLLPAALTAILLAAAGQKELQLGRRLARTIREHWLLFGLVTAALVAAGVRAVAGGDVYSVFGRYANVGRRGLPNPWRVIELAVQHIAALDLALGVIPFLGTLVAAFVFLRAGLPRRYLPFAAVAVSFTAWLILQIAVGAALFDVGGELPRIHERFMIYAVPFFIVALLAAARLPEQRASGRIYLGAAALAAVLPAVIPFQKVINRTIGVDTFGLLLLSRARGDTYVPVSHATIAAVGFAALLALTYVRVSRRSTRAIAVHVTGVFVLMSVAVWSAIGSASTSGRSVLPAHADWVDRASPAGDVILVSDANAVPALETAFHNLTISHVYTLCQVTFGPEFGERRVTIDDAGRLLDSDEHLGAPLAVVPARLGVSGRVVARNPYGKQVLVAPAEGRLTLASRARTEGCG